MAQRPNRTTIELPPPLREALERFAAKTGRSQAELIRQAIWDLLKKEGEL